MNQGVGSSPCPLLTAGAFQVRPIAHEWSGKIHFNLKPGLQADPVAVPSLEDLGLKDKEPDSRAAAPWKGHGIRGTEQPP